LKLPGMLLSFTGMALLPAICCLTDWLSAANHDGHSLGGVLGSLGMTTTVCLMAKSHRDLGEQWTATPYQVDRAQLITHGIYAEDETSHECRALSMGNVTALVTGELDSQFRFFAGLSFFYPMRLHLKKKRCARPRCAFLR
jgi:hypothetical protein